MIDTEADTLADLAIGVRDRLPQVSELLLEEISRATIHHAGKIPHNVITMNAEVEFVDEASEATRIVQLVYPRQADIAANRISILTPVGAGLIGLREGQSILWRSEEHTSELQSLMRISYAVFCLEKQQIPKTRTI